MTEMSAWSTEDGHRDADERCAGGGGALGSPPPASSYSPPCLQWAHSLRHLLDDPDGVELFQKFHKQEGCNDALDFWFACEGVKKQENKETAAHMMRVVASKLLPRLPPYCLCDETRRELSQKASSDQALELFGRAQAEVEDYISSTTYPNFLSSDIYLKYIQDCRSTSPVSSLSPRSPPTPVSPPSCAMLPTLHEDLEFVSQPVAPVQRSLLPLTKGALFATQRRRGDYNAALEHMPDSGVPNPYYHHATYASYNPVSCQDSELQSLSSDAQTEDSQSLTDGSIVDRHCSVRNKHPTQRRLQRQLRESATLNREPMPHHMIIPRTQRVAEEQKLHVTPDVFANLLISKLECLKKRQEAQEKVQRKLHETDGDDVFEGITPKTLAAAIREKLPQSCTEDSDQSILDKHVSRVWAEETPTNLRSPSSPPQIHSPPRKPRVPPVNIHQPPQVAKPHHNTHYYPRGGAHMQGKQRRKEKDVYSTFSSDSGNVYDFPEEFHMTKSKSMPDYTDTQRIPEHPGVIERNRGPCGGSREVRKPLCKKPSTELTDSGVSVVSDTPPIAPITATANERVLYWMLENKKYGPDDGNKQKTKSSLGSSTSPVVARRNGGSRTNRQQPSAVRSGSLERRSVGAWLGGGPCQPLAGDPFMPPLPQPHTSTQLEEARRRLEEDVRGKIAVNTSRNQQAQRLCGSSTTGNKGLVESISNPSTLSRNKIMRGSVVLDESGSGSSYPSNVSMSTVVMYNFCEEKVPYRSKVAGSPITLRQFKELMPKRRNYRYYFKAPCEEVEAKVILEEIMDDNETLPLWEGKVMAVVKPVD